MSAVGIFAGRGDVLVAIALAGLIGIYAGWLLRGGSEWLRRKLVR